MSCNVIKFRIKTVNNTIPKDPRLEELKYWCKQFSLHDFALPNNSVSYGNLSFRLQENKNLFIITASGIGLKNSLSDDCFVKVPFCNLEEKIVGFCGFKKPSSESMLHFAIYQQRKNVNAIFHGHCNKLLSFAKELGIPETSKEEPEGSIELVQSVINALDKNNFLVLKNHGFISLGRRMKDAGRLALEVYEKSCQL